MNLSKSNHPILKKAFSSVLFVIAIVFVISGSLMLFYHDYLSGWLTFFAVSAYLMINIVFLTKLKQTLKTKYWLFSIALFIGVFGFYLLQQPSHDRDWRGDMTVLPSIEFIDNNTVKIKNYRNFEYRTRDDFDAIYTDRIIHVSDIESIDFYLSYWLDIPIAHTFVSFNIKNEEPVTISIEARYEKDERFDPIASMFREFEIIYVVGAESDIVKVRTDFRNEQVYRYPLNISAQSAQQLFLTYAQRINLIDERPEFYHLLNNSCTINIARYANKVGRTGGFDWRILINGFSDLYLYSNEYTLTDIPFRELRELAHINDLAENADGSIPFHQVIRERLPSF